MQRIICDDPSSVLGKNTREVKSGADVALESEEATETEKEEVVG